MMKRARFQSLTLTRDPIEVLLFKLSYFSENRYRA
jgi:hypothetical protein